MVIAVAAVDVVQVLRTIEPVVLNSLTSLSSPALMVGRTPGQEVRHEPASETGSRLTVPATVFGYVKRGAENPEDEAAADAAEDFVADIVSLIKGTPEFGTARTAKGHIQNSRVLADNQSVTWDGSSILVEVRFEFYTFID